MNSAIVLFVVCAAVVEVFAGPHGPHGPHGEKMKQSVEECKASTGVDPELLKAERNGEEINDHNMKCFKACITKKMGFMSEDGIVDKEKFINAIPPHVPEDRKEEMKQERAKCAELTGEDECETASLIFNCMRPHMKHHHRKHDNE